MYRRLTECQNLAHIDVNNVSPLEILIDFHLCLDGILRECLLIIIDECLTTIPIHAIRIQNIAIFCIQSQLILKVQERIFQKTGSIFYIHIGKISNK